MKSIKGCINEDCVGYKKIHYDETDYFCSKCGQKLYYVCADCWSLLEIDDNRYCASCEAIRKEKKEKRISQVRNASITAIATVGAGAKIAKDKITHK